MRLITVGAICSRGALRLTRPQGLRWLRTFRRDMAIPPVRGPSCRAGVASRSLPKQPKHFGQNLGPAWYQGSLFTSPTLLPRSPAVRRLLRAQQPQPQPVSLPASFAENSANAAMTCFAPNPAWRARAVLYYRYRIVGAGGITTPGCFCRALPARTPSPRGWLNVKGDDRSPAHQASGLPNIRISEHEVVISGLETVRIILFNHINGCIPAANQRTDS
jgi:hypothetical protein